MLMGRGSCISVMWLLVMIRSREADLEVFLDRKE
jgi:hypothetical protein